MVFPIPTFQYSNTPALQSPEDEDEDENEKEKRGNWRRWMGIEPTWDFV